MNAYEVVRALGEFIVPDEHEEELQEVILEAFSQQEIDEAVKQLYT